MPVEKCAGEVDNGLRAGSCDTNGAYRIRSDIRKGSRLGEKEKTHAVQGWRRFTIKTYQSAEDRSGCSQAHLLTQNGANHTFKRIDEHREP
jgi:hypothetical protein